MRHAARHSSRWSSTLAASRLRDAVADVGAEVVAGSSAQASSVGVLGVHGQERLAQALAGAVGEGGDRVGAHAEQRGDLGGLLALDLGVPQHQLPALGQRRERARRRRRSRSPRRRCRGTGTPGSNGVEVVGRLQPGRRRGLVDVQAADGGEQVGAERQVGAAAALEHGEHLGERLGDQVVGVAGRGQLARQAAGGVDVAAEELAVGVDVAAADGRDQLGVARLLARWSAGGSHRVDAATRRT